MLIKLDKSAITAFDHRTRRKVYTDEILYNGKPLVLLASEDSV